MRHPFWMGLAVAAIGTFTTLAATAERNHRAEQRTPPRPARLQPRPPRGPRLAPNYGESEFR